MSARSILELVIKRCAAFALAACLAPPCSAVCADAVDLSPLKLDGLVHMRFGVTRAGQMLTAVVPSENTPSDRKKLRVLIIGGIDGSPHTTGAATEVMRRFHTDDEFAPFRALASVAAVPCAHPEAWQRRQQASTASESSTIVDNEPPPTRVLSFPPEGDHYTSADNVEAQYLWRWIGLHAPDYVVVLSDGETSGPASDDSHPSHSLVVALNDAEKSLLGPIHAHRWQVRPGDTQPFQQLVGLFKDATEKLTVDDLSSLYSEAHRELLRRLERSPLEVAKQLATHYGRELPTSAYIPAMAAWGRLRFGELDRDPTHQLDLMRLSKPFVLGQRPTLPDKFSGSDIAGHYLWGEMFRATENEAYKSLVVKAANLAFDAEGRPLEAMPQHSEMSDSVFMCCPILAQAGRLTGDDKYYQMCVKHLRFMQRLDLRADGLYRHSPLDETAWGRGNGFPALGLALTLSELPEEHPLREEVLSSFRAHMKALLPYQSPTGEWHQVIDHPESYREYTATCMITFALARGTARGWLDRRDTQPAIERAWSAIQRRTGDDGRLIDVCASTGKMKSLREYLDRPAILGRDPRGGAMGLLVATELAASGIK